ncbi:hypothetical protein SGR_7128t [Streptomyces griseus subsp. griseus NBRC 13350]|uniref:Uncharacterized protein n=1 Tax=Streptomyces griseus subsp. griseus (strain JCM 4626 / CBS 651.72 / NBRC 13350 / KCC S-0626 / ISP 5235) TaxID=455632 RepID=B1VKK9_STRGG|nr:hypothetical protein SGR_11t [Streptomyces griseus subsp. griseus NBRC 13350]BAG23955.1 hypothetical protein SGR_7128t [Streptomyces griseus subsp. griseus NBRC 13350]
MRRIRSLRPGSQPQQPVRVSIPRFVGRHLQHSVQLVPGLLVAGVGDPLQLAQVASRYRASSQQEPSVHGSLVQQLAQLHDVARCVGEIGQPVQSGLVTLIGQLTQGLPVGIHVRHDAMVQPCP